MLTVYEMNGLVTFTVSSGNINCVVIDTRDRII